MSRFGRDLYAIQEEIAQDTTYSDEGNSFVFATIHSKAGVKAKYLQLANGSESDDLSVKIDGRAGSVFTLYAGQIFELRNGDAQVSSVAFENANSGGSPVSVEIVYTI